MARTKPELVHRHGCSASILRPLDGTMPVEVCSTSEDDPMPDTDNEVPIWAPRAFSADELALVNVRVISLVMQLVECTRCGERWRVERGPGWWACPMGCHARLG